MTWQSITLSGVRLQSIGSGISLPETVNITYNLHGENMK